MNPVQKASQMCREELSGNHNEELRDAVHRLMHANPELMHKQLDFIMWVSQEYGFEPTIVPISEIPERFVEDEFYYLGWYVLRCAEEDSEFEYLIDGDRLISRKIADEEPPWKRRGGIDPSIN